MMMRIAAPSRATADFRHRPIGFLVANGAKQDQPERAGGEKKLGQRMREGKG